MNKLCIYMVHQGSSILHYYIWCWETVMGAVLSVVGCWAASLEPTHWMAAVVTTKTPKIFPDIAKCPWGTLRPTVLCIDVESSSSGYSKKRKVQNSTYIVCCHLWKKGKNIFCYITACIFISSLKTFKKLATLVTPEKATKSGQGEWDSLIHLLLYSENQLIILVGSQVWEPQCISNIILSDHSFLQSGDRVPIDCKPTWWFLSKP